MIPLSLREIAEITGAQVVGLDADPDLVLVDGPVVTDSREAGSGGLYVARIGEHLDGHDFVPQAAAAGSVASLTSLVVQGFPCLVVPDVQEAFAALARAVVDRSPQLVVVGVTGSSGKTGTKDLLGEVLGRHAPTVVPEGSLNSEVGVPLTVCRVRPETRFLVVEMGARGIGHLAYLARMAPPRIGIVLNVGSAHVGEFGSREAIAVAKSELPAALPADGVAVLNADDPAVRAMAGVTAARVVLVGRAPDAQVRATDVVLDGQGRASFTVTVDRRTARATLPLHGEHHVANSLAVIAAALECGLDLQAVVGALASARPASRWRMEVSTRADGVTVVNDAYNANPDSMAAALRAVAAMAPAGGSGRTWAVLGSMLELGEESGSGHAGVGRLARELGTHRLLVVGETARPMLEGWAAADPRRASSGGGQAGWVPDADAAYALLQEELAPGDVVLLKSSRDAGLRWLGDRLAEPVVPPGVLTDDSTDDSPDHSPEPQTEVSP